MEIERKSPETTRERARRGKIYGQRGGTIRDPKFRSVNVEEVNFQDEGNQIGLAGQMVLNRVDASGNGFIDMTALGVLGEFTLTGAIIPSADAGGAGQGSILGSAARAYGLVRSYLFSTASDKRLKKDIRVIEYGLAEINKLKPVRYKYLKGDDEKLGFIAQDLKEILPEVVDGAEETFYGVSYNEIIPVLVKSIQELSQKVGELQERQDVCVAKKKLKKDVRQ